MKITNLSELESEALLKEQMGDIKGEGDGPTKVIKCLSCFCPGVNQFELYFDVNAAALLDVPDPEPDK
ncbi:MAG: hypothetical protein J6Y27_01005 [Bacteroidales bacterium]|nr:hypothetical protein [Bacteroidales bacterium]